jgi:hypothetical protein
MLGKTQKIIIGTYIVVLADHLSPYFSGRYAFSRLELPHGIKNVGRMIRS